MIDPNDILDQIPGETAAERIVRASLLMVDCSATVDTPRYVRCIVRPADRTLQKLTYYTEDSKLSTCQIAQLRAVGIAGCTEPELVNGYKPGAISADQRAAWSRFKAFDDVKPGDDLELAASDGIWIDDGTGHDVHAATCVTDGRRVDANTIVVDTVEGGQWKVRDDDPKEKAIGTTAQRRFTRTLVRKADGRWYMGARHVIVVLRSSKLPIPTTPFAATGPDGVVTIGTSEAIHAEAIADAGESGSAA